MRVGSVGGSTGPLSVLVPGVKKQQIFSEEFMMKHGAPVGSNVYMNENGFMTTKTWLELLPDLIRGIRAMPVIVDNPDWWCALLVDGFNAHCLSAEAMQMLHDNKIILVKEEPDSSHFCQVYDQLVTKGDKATAREVLDDLRLAKACSTSENKPSHIKINKWTLVNVLIEATVKTSPETWINSAKKVNLYPPTRVCFADWIKKITMN